MCFPCFGLGCPPPTPTPNTQYPAHKAKTKPAEEHIRTISPSFTSVVSRPPDRTFWGVSSSSGARPPATTGPPRLLLGSGGPPCLSPPSLPPSPLAVNGVLDTESSVESTSALRARHLAARLPPPVLPGRSKAPSITSLRSGGCIPRMGLGRGASLNFDCLFVCAADSGVSHALLVSRWVSQVISPPPPSDSIIQGPKLSPSFMQV